MAHQRVCSIVLEPNYNDYSGISKPIGNTHGGLPRDKSSTAEVDNQCSRSSTPRTLARPLGNSGQTTARSSSPLKGKPRNVKTSAVISSPAANTLALIAQLESGLHSLSAKIPPADELSGTPKWLQPLHTSDVLRSPETKRRNAVARRLDYSPQQVAATAAELGPVFPGTRPISSGASRGGRASSSSCSFSLEDVEQMLWSVQRLSGLLAGISERTAQLSVSMERSKQLLTRQLQAAQPAVTPPPLHSVHHAMAGHSTTSSAYCVRGVPSGPESSLPAALMMEQAGPVASLCADVDHPFGLGSPSGHTQYVRLAPWESTPSSAALAAADTAVAFVHQGIPDGSTGNVNSQQGDVCEEVARQPLQAPADRHLTLSAMDTDTPVEQLAQAPASSAFATLPAMAVAGASTEDDSLGLHPAGSMLSCDPHARCQDQASHTPGLQLLLQRSLALQASLSLTAAHSTSTSEGSVYSPRAAGLVVIDACIQGMLGGSAAAAGVASGQGSLLQPEVERLLHQVEMADELTLQEQAGSHVYPSESDDEPSASPPWDTEDPNPRASQAYCRLPPRQQDQNQASYRDDARGAAPAVLSAGCGLSGSRYSMQSRYSIMSSSASSVEEEGGLEGTSGEEEEEGTIQAHCEVQRDSLRTDKMDGSDINNDGDDNDDGSALLEDGLHEPARTDSLSSQGRGAEAEARGEAGDSFTFTPAASRRESFAGSCSDAGPVGSRGAPSHLQLEALGLGAATHEASGLSLDSGAGLQLESELESPTLFLGGSSSTPSKRPQLTVRLPSEDGTGVHASAESLAAADAAANWKGSSGGKDTGPAAWHAGAHLLLSPIGCGSNLSSPRLQSPLPPSPYWHLRPGAAGAAGGSMHGVVVGGRVPRNARQLGGGAVPLPLSPAAAGCSCSFVNSPGGYGDWAWGYGSLPSPGTPSMQHGMLFSLTKHLGMVTHCLFHVDSDEDE